VKLAREVVLFAVGGVLGFLVDASIVQVLVREAGLNPYLARIPSFLVAASVTWWWNRHLSFAHRRSADRRREWLRWVVVMSGGAVLNYGIYAALVAMSATVRHWPAVGVAAGSAVAAFVNFLTARKLVFNKHK
jgi:putative flippase GtrA